MFPREHRDIPGEFKEGGRAVLLDGTRIGLTKHSRLRFWQRVRTNVTDAEIKREAVSALISGDPRFRFCAHIFNNPYRPTIIYLITVLSENMRLPPFYVTCRWERDVKWHQHLEECQTYLQAATELEAALKGQDAPKS